MILTCQDYSDKKKLPAYITTSIWWQHCHWLEFHLIKLQNYFQNCSISFLKQKILTKQNKKIKICINQINCLYELQKVSNKNVMRNKGWEQIVVPLLKQAQKTNHCDSESNSISSSFTRLCICLSENCKWHVKE